MPASARPMEEIEAYKEKILETALDIVSKEGFLSLSMRKISERLAVSATAIYYYYLNKDEIYLGLQTKGFEQLYARFKKIHQKKASPVTKLKNFIEQYLDFGINNPYLYEIMFTLNTPKYADFVGTELEPVAHLEKQTALSVAEISAALLSEIIASNPRLSKMDPSHEVVILWTSLHGVVSLINSRVLQEVETNMEDFLESFKSKLVAVFA